MYRLVSKGTVEEVIYMRQLYKQTLQTNILDSSHSRGSMERSVDKKQREFEGIQGVKGAQGELFGLYNLMQHTGVSILHSLRQKYHQKDDHANEKKISTGAKKLLALNLELLPKTEVIGLLRKDLGSLEMEEYKQGADTVPPLPHEAESPESGKEEDSEVPLKSNGYSNILELIGCSSKDAQLHNDILREQPAPPTQIYIGLEEEDNDNDDRDESLSMDVVDGDGEVRGGGTGTAGEEGKGSEGEGRSEKPHEAEGKGGDIEGSLSIPTTTTLLSLSSISGRKRVLPNSMSRI